MSQPPSSRLPGFYRLTPAQRQDLVADQVGLNDTQRDTLGVDSLPITRADLMVENVIGTFALPMGVGVNFTIYR